MTPKRAPKSSKATLARVTANLAKPRTVESAKKNGDTLENGGHVATAPSMRKPSTPRLEFASGAISEDRTKAMILNRAIFLQSALNQPAIGILRIT